MEITKTITEGLEDLPSREVWHFGPKMVSCSEKIIIKHRNYTFELCVYDINGNGKKYVKMLDSVDKQVLENMTINLKYSWVAGYTVEFFNEYNPISNCYFQFKAKTDFGLEAVLDKLVLIAEKMKICSKFYPSFQYVYAYIIFLFFQIKDDKIRASEFSETYNVLKKMRACISGELTDNANGYNFSKETIYYKVFDRFLNKQLETFKNKSIIYN